MTQLRCPVWVGLTVLLAACGGAVGASSARAPAPAARAAGSARGGGGTRVPEGDVCDDLAHYEEGQTALRQERGDAIVLSYRTGMRRDPARLEAIESAAQGVDVGDFVVFEGLVVGPRRFLSLAVQGRSDNLLSRLRPYGLEGVPGQLEPGTIVLGRELAEALGVGRGEEVGVVPLLPVDSAVPPPLEGTAAPVQQRPGRLHRLRVAALVAFPANGILALDHDEVVMRLADAQRIWAESGAGPDDIGGHVLHMPSAATAPAEVENVRAALSNELLRVVPLAELEQGGQWTLDIIRRWCAGP